MISAPSGMLHGSDQETWRTYLEATRLLLDELDRRLHHDAGLSLADYGLLFRLATSDVRGMRMSELAQGTVSSRSRISHAVDRLERLGWVERSACPTDRRGSYASITELGRTKLGEAEPGHSEVVRRHLLDHLAPGGGRFERGHGRDPRLVADRLVLRLSCDPSSS